MGQGIAEKTVMIILLTGEEYGSIVEMPEGEAQRLIECKAAKVYDESELKKLTIKLSDLEAYLRNLGNSGYGVVMPGGVLCQNAVFNNELFRFDFSPDAFSSYLSPERRILLFPKAFAEVKMLIERQGLCHGFKVEFV